MSLEALVFDVDGTLADTEETHRQAFNYAFVRYELKWEWTKPLYRDLLKISGGKERIGHFIGTLPIGLGEKARLCQLAGGIHRTKTELYNELIGDGRCPLRPGVARLLAEAQEAGLRLAIASTTTAANVDALLTRHLGRRGLQQFHSVSCGDLVQQKKPQRSIAHSLSLCMIFSSISSLALSSWSSLISTLTGTVGVSTRKSARKLIWSIKPL